MRNGNTLGLALLLGALGLTGCGVADDDFQAGNRLIVDGVTDVSGSTAPVFAAVEWTNDGGPDNDPATLDDNNPGFPDPEEEILAGGELRDDLGKVALRNQPRLGVSPGVDLHVYRVDVTYYDDNGASRFYAPRVTYWPTLRVPNDGTATLDVILVPVAMKQGGLRDAFLFGTSAEKAAARKWTAVVDVYARDLLNGDGVHAGGSITIQFINPLVEGAPK